MALVAGLLALPLGLGGCSSDDPKPKIAPPETSAPTVSQSPTATPASDSPEDVVRAWVDAQNVALTTGDAGALRRFSADPCRACNDFIRPIERVYRSGGYFKTAGWAVDAARARPNSKDPIVVNAAVTIAGGTTLTKAGRDPVVYEEDKRILVFKLVEQDSRLVVSFVGFVS